MNVKHLLECVDVVAIASCCCVLATMAATGQIRRFRTIALFLTSGFVLLAIQVPLLYHRKATGLDFATAWKIFFYSTESLDLLQIATIIAIIYSVFNEAMRPFKGLQHIGNVVFRWVAAVSVVLAAIFAFGPQVISSTARDPITAALSTLIERSQEGTGILTLCLLLFVCVSIKPLGLTYRSRVFGVTFGLAVMTTTNLVQAAWLCTTGARSVYSPIYLFGTIGYVCAVVVWGVYFAIEEPERKMVLLPTTSPFFHWNRIAEALGDPPGHVAVGFKPSMISPHEARAFTLMSRYKRERDAAMAASEDETTERISLS